MPKSLAAPVLISAFHNLILGLIFVIMANLRQVHILIQQVGAVLSATH